MIDIITADFQHVVRAIACLLALRHKLVAGINYGDVVLVPVPVLATEIDNKI